MIQPAPNVIDITGLVIAAATLLVSVVGAVIGGAWIVGNKVTAGFADMKDNIAELTVIAAKTTEMVERHETMLMDHSEVVAEWRAERRAEQIIAERESVAGRISHRKAESGA